MRLYRSIFKEIDSKLKYKFKIASKEEFEDAILNIATLSLEDDQVRYPQIDSENQTLLFSGSNYDLYVLNRKKLPPSGPFELVIEDGDVIGFIRGTKFNKIISFNLIHLQDEARGSGIGTNIYEQLLQSGYTIKSDSEITDSTHSLYLKLLSKGYKPLIFNDNSVGFKK
jgi:hypothetical protein